MGNIFLKRNTKTRTLLLYIAHVFASIRCTKDEMLFVDRKNRFFIVDNVECLLFSDYLFGRYSCYTVWYTITKCVRIFKIFKLWNLFWVCVLLTCIRNDHKRNTTWGKVLQFRFRFLNELGTFRWHPPHLY